MALNSYVVSGAIGVDLTKTSSVAGYAPGTVVQLSDGGTAIYVKGLSELSTFAAVVVDASAGAVMTTTTRAATAFNATGGVGASTRFAVSHFASISSAFYGWVQMSGVLNVNLAANCDDGVPLFTTATAGVLDDATISLGYIQGLVSTTTISNATMVTCIAAYAHLAPWAGSP